MTSAKHGTIPSDPLPDGHCISVMTVDRQKVWKRIDELSEGDVVLFVDPRWREIVRKELDRA